MVQTPCSARLELLSILAGTSWTSLLPQLSLEQGVLFSTQESWNDGFTIISYPCTCGGLTLAGCWVPLSHSPSSAPQGTENIFKDSSHSSSGPGWGPSHGNQSSRNFSSASPSHGLQFFICSSHFFFLLLLLWKTADTLNNLLIAL